MSGDGWDRRWKSSKRWPEGMESDVERELNIIWAAELRPLSRPQSEG